MTPRAMLDELLRVGAVVETDQNWFKVIRREYVPDALAPDFLERLGRGVHDFVHTLEENMQKSSTKVARFERTVRPDAGLNEKDLPAFDAYIRSRCQQLLEEIDNWLSKLEPPEHAKGDKAVQTGIGIYHFVVDDNTSDLTINELLQDRTLTKQ